MELGTFSYVGGIVMVISGTGLNCLKCIGCLDVVDRESIDEYGRG